MPKGVYNHKNNSKKLKMWWANHIYSDTCKCRRCCSKRNEKFHSIVPWNKGLTKDTDERMKNLTNKSSISRKGMPSSLKGKKLEEIVGEQRSKQIKEKRNLKLKGKIGWLKGLTKETDERIKKMSEKKKGHIESEETRKKKSLSMLGKNKGIENGMYGKHQTEKAKKSISKKLKGRGHSHTEETKQLLREYALEQFKDGMPQETKNKIRKKSLDMWSDLNKREFIIKRTVETLWKRPTKLESSFIDFFKKYDFPFTYVGDGKIIIGYKIPDFVETNGKKIIIEVGNKTEKNLHYRSWENYVNNRMKHFKKYGWNCIVLWDEELLNEIELFKKIEGYLNERSIIK